MRAAIDLLADLRNQALLVLGDMGEIGAQGPTFHAEMGHYARERGIAQLLTIGELSLHATQAFGGPARHFDDIDALIAAVRAQSCDAVLVKGSRFMRMERVVRALTEASPARVAPSPEPQH